MQEPIPNPDNTSNNPSSPEAAKPASSILAKMRSKKVILAIFAIIILILGAYLFTRNKTNKSNTPEYVVATIGGEKIYKSDIQKEAEKTHPKESVNEEILAKAQEVLLEKKIIQAEAAKQGITVSEEDVRTHAKGSLKDKTNDLPQELLDQYQFILLQDRVKAAVVESRSAFTAEYWTPSESYPSGELSPDMIEKINKQRVEGKEALLAIEEIVRKGEDMFSASKDLIQEEEYSNIKEILAVNGYILNKTQNQSVLKTPKVYTQDDKKTLGDRFYDALFALKEGEITLVFADSYTSGKVFQVTKATDSQYKTYKEWLDSKMKEILSK